MLEHALSCQHVPWEQVPEPFYEVLKGPFRMKLCLQMLIKNPKKVDLLLLSNKMLLYRYNDKENEKMRCETFVCTVRQLTSIASQGILRNPYYIQVQQYTRCYCTIVCTLLISNQLFLLNDLLICIGSRLWHRVDNLAFQVLLLFDHSLK